MFPVPKPPVQPVKPPEDDTPTLEGRVQKVLDRLEEQYGLSAKLKLAGMVLGGLAVAGVLGTGWVYRAPLNNWLAEHIAEATGATADKVVVEGVVYTGKDELATALGLKKGDSLVGFNTGAARKRIENLPWVRLAAVERQLPSTVKVSIYEHTPLARVESEAEIWVINKEGELIIPDNDEKFKTLPLLEGKGAATAAANLFAVLGGWPNLTGQLAKAVYVGERRWDLQFTSGVLVKLPEENMPQALKVLAKLEEARHVLTLNAGEVDLRLPDRIVLRLPAEVGATPVTNKPQDAGLPNDQPAKAEPTKTHKGKVHG